MFTTNAKNGFSVKAWQGDAKTLLAFDLPAGKKNKLAGFTIACAPGDQAAYYLYNLLEFSNPAGFAQKNTETPHSSINAPIQKFRWLHVPGSFHQADGVFYGKYTYTVTPRYFDAQNKLLTIDPTLSVTVSINVEPYTKGKLELGFTRGFVQSQAFANHFGDKAIFRPATKDLIFDTTAIAGKNSDGESYTFLDEYTWSGFTAREKIYAVLGEVLKDTSLAMDVFAYDLNEPDIITAFLTLGKQGRLRIIVDNASLHHDKAMDKPEDKFETAFSKVVKSPAGIKRGKFSRFQHHKVIIVKEKATDIAVKVLTGSTNFSVTGVYVNSNHVAVFNDKAVAQLYSSVFNEAWNDDVLKKAFVNTDLAKKVFSFKGYGGSDMNIHFSPHPDDVASSVLDDIAKRVKAEKSSVFFAVMDMDPTVKGPVTPALVALHKNQKIFSYGISDSTTGIFLYKPSSANGIKVTGKAGATLLPPPFNKEASIGIGHQVHHKFIVCGFNTANAVVWFGSSNLAAGGEEDNGDNLIQVNDQDIATVFAIEALALVDHFMFRDKFSIKNTTKRKPEILTSNDTWTKKYFDPKDLYYKDRVLFR